MYKYSTRIVVVYFSFYILITFIKGFYLFFHTSNCNCTKYSLYWRIWQKCFYISMPSDLYTIISLLLMMDTHCRESCYKHYDWKIVANRGTSQLHLALILGDAWRYVLLQFVELWYSKVKIDIFRIMRSLAISLTV